MMCLVCSAIVLRGRVRAVGKPSDEPLHKGQDLNLLHTPAGPVPTFPQIAG